METLDSIPNGATLCRYIIDYQHFGIIANVAVNTLLCPMWFGFFANKEGVGLVAPKMADDTNSLRNRNRALDKAADTVDVVALHIVQHDFGYEAGTFA